MRLANFHDKLFLQLRWFFEPTTLDIHEMI